MTWTCENGHSNEEPAIICTECGAAPFVKIPKDRPTKRALHEPWPGSTGTWLAHPGSTTGEWLAHPHAGGCAGCREDKVCNVCGKPLPALYSGGSSRCTNGRCMDCHSAVCAPGGATSPGHGYGYLGDAQQAAARRRQK